METPQNPFANLTQQRRAQQLERSAARKQRQRAVAQQVWESYLANRPQGPMGTASLPQMGRQIVGAAPNQMEADLANMQSILQQGTQSTGG